MGKPTYIQHVALGKLIKGAAYGHPIAPKTMAVLEREGWVRNGDITYAGRIAHWETTNPQFRGPRPALSVEEGTIRVSKSKPHECNEDCYHGYCEQMTYPEPRSVAPDAYTRTAVYLGELRDV